MLSSLVCAVSINVLVPFRIHEIVNFGYLGRNQHTRDYLLIELAASYQESPGFKSQQGRELLILNKKELLITSTIA